MLVTLALALMAAIWSPNSAWQVRALKNSAFDVFLGGAKGVSKSEVLMAASFRRVDHPLWRVLILRERLDETTEIADRLHALFAKWPSGRRPSWNGSDHMFRFPSRAFIRLGYCRVKEDVTLYQGREWTRIHFDEMANVKDAGVADALIAEIRCKDPSLPKQFMASGNPGFGGHAWVKARYVDTCGVDGSKVHWFSTEVPGLGTVHLSRAYVPGTVFDNPVYSKDPLYMAQLYQRPEKERRRLIFGDWDAAGGAYLDEIGERHMVAPFEIPSNWALGAGFDWGHAHPFALCWGGWDFDGTLYVADTLWGHRKKDHEIALQILRQAPRVRDVVIRAGGDAFQHIQARVDGVIPSTEERFKEFGLSMMRAPGTHDRALNGMNLRDYVSYKGRGPGGEDIAPRIRLMDTPGNRKLVKQLESVPEDEDDPEYPKKVDVNSDTGEGGDDGFDALMNLVGVRPIYSRKPYAGKLDIDAFAPATLAYMAEQAKRGRHPKVNTNVPMPGELAG